MSTSRKKLYWKGLHQLENGVEPPHANEREFVEREGDEDLYHSRRDFLKTMGFSLTAASVAACQAPVRKAIPFADKPDGADPGIPNYYASTYAEGSNYCSIVVKTREGRPIKIAGNTSSRITRGGVNAQVEASVMSLYDEYRLRHPQKGGKKADWEDVDKDIRQRLASLADAGKAIRLVANTVLSPGTQAAIDKFTSTYPTAVQVVYDPVSYYGMRVANEASFGEAFLPRYDFSKAKCIVGIGADFLGTWLSPISFAGQYAQNRKVSEDRRDMSRHYQFEANLTLTGANADYRTAVRPSDEGKLIVQLYNLLAAKAGRSRLPVDEKPFTHLEEAAKELWKNRRAALVVGGSNDPSAQLLINAINDMLGAYGRTVSTQPVNYMQGDDRAMAALVSDMEAGRIGAVIFYGCNPVYDHPMGERIAAALNKTSLSVSTSYTENETAAQVAYHAPDHHYLEAWNDFEPEPGSYSLAQPVITPLFDTRAAQESLMAWAGDKRDYFSFLKDSWQTRFESVWKEQGDFQSFWDRCLYDGVFEAAAATPSSALSFVGDVANAARTLNAQAKPSADDVEVTLYESCALGAGVQANNPLLQELPDPITKTVWDNCATVSQHDAKRLGLRHDAEGHTHYVALTAGDKTLKIPALVQPGQAPGTVGIALGYGRTKVGKVGHKIGVNVYPWVLSAGPSLSYRIATGVAMAKLDEPYQLAQTQIQSTYMGRHSVIQEARLDEFKKDPYAGREFPKISKWDKKVDPGALSLWKGHAYKNHHWGMAIDLNACTGCSACIVACNVENNVAVVGKDEVLRRREMHWLRIDRYYSSTSTDVSDYEQMERAAENPEVVFQPMLCQHCNNAPCETVCPVAATTHSTEGLNQMTYNRCIGTRYCANNCPYKVRRFNWFKYHHNKKFAAVNPAMNTDLGRMVLNPDVTVRSRGVMEKCSFCVQRIQTGKLKAKKERRPVRDGDIVTACQASCTAGAIVFGDLNDPNSRLSKLLKAKPDKENPYSPDKEIGNPRAYRVLEEISVKPNVFYLTKIKNKNAVNS